MTSVRRSNRLAHAALVIVTALAIGAPTPGQISGCSASTNTVEFQTYCVNFEERVCYRDAESGRIDGAGYDACRASIANRCSGGNFPPGCAPSESTAQACYDALVDPGRFGVEASLGNPGLPECQAICGVEGI
jgi:hypothetical protein